MAIDKSLLGIAGEFAVAAELCRRNLYAQLTLGHQKRIDLLVIKEEGFICRFEVKAKQNREWPGCRGIATDDSFLVFVDFAGKAEAERPDFYILTAAEWRALATASVERYRAKHPGRRVEVTEDNEVIFHDEVNRYKKPYKGVGVRAEDIQAHKEAWEKVVRVVRQ